MLKIRDYIEENENIIIRINASASKDPCESLSKTIYEGMLWDIPAEYHDCEVMKAGWLLGAQMHQLTIYLGDF